jgi:hypothetical protein
MIELNNLKNFIIQNSGWVHFKSSVASHLCLTGMRSWFTQAALGGAAPSSVAVQESVNYVPRNPPVFFQWQPWCLKQIGYPKSQWIIGSFCGFLMFFTVFFSFHEMLSRMLWVFAGFRDASLGGKTPWDSVSPGRNSQSTGILTTPNRKSLASRTITIMICSGAWFFLVLVH